MPSYQDLLLELLSPSPSLGAVERGKLLLERALDSIVPQEGELLADLPCSDTSPNPHQGKDASFIASMTPIWLISMAKGSVATVILESQLFQIYLRMLDVAKESPFLPPHEYLGEPLPPDTVRLGLHMATLRHFPQSFREELLGATLAALGNASPLVGHAQCIGPLMEQALKTAGHEALDETRIRKGYALFRNGCEKVFRPLSPSLQTRRKDVAALLLPKIKAAKGYHSRVNLEGDPLEVWFENAETDLEGLVKALERSPFVNGSCPHQSRLIQAMTFGGPMFGVFTEDERERTLRWIESPEAATDLKPVLSEEPIEAWDEPPGKSSPARSARSSRHQYRCLMAAENISEAQRDARPVIQRILNRTALAQQFGLLPKAFDYSKTALNEFVTRQHEKAIRPKQDRGPRHPLDREDWRWILTQLAPAVLIDGAWLSGVPAVPSMMKPWHHELVRILDDELGQGDRVQNHPLIFRGLLESLGVSLPEGNDPEFTTDSRFRSQAFDFATYMLAMGWMYGPFEAECLGLNLAIELSGLGRGYLDAIASMKACGIDPLIIELHLSIDNPASGHTHRAQNAITLYLEAIRQSEGSEAQSIAWRRIFRGYLSYRIALIPLTITIVSRILIRKWWPCKTNPPLRAESSY